MPSNHVDNFQILALRKISHHRRASLVNNRFQKNTQQQANVRSGVGGGAFRKHNPFSALGGSETKRVSLITGKQMSYTPTTKRSRNYRRIQLIIYNYLERPSGFYAAVYQIVMYCVASIYLLPFIFRPFFLYFGI